MNRVGIIDYGLCNLDSVRRAVEECGGDPVMVSVSGDLATVDRVILPGVGAFPNAMEGLKTRQLIDPLAEVVMEHRRPFLGICLGMQLICNEGSEGQPTKGLGWVDADVARLEPDRDNVRIPHMGWNEVWQTKSSALFAGIPDGADFYFVHSFHVRCQTDVAIGQTPYCGGFVSALGQEHVMAVQFHPEKSQRVGFRLLRNFLAL